MAPLMNMRRALIIIALLALLDFLQLYSQELTTSDFLAQIEKIYGSDADLVNGEKYFYPYYQSLGDPFFLPESQSAKITIHEKEFEGQMLRYDIFNQKLILDYENIYGASSSLVLRNEWVESFAFEGRRFIFMHGPDGNPGFFQLVTEGPVNCVYHWSKEHLLNLSSGVQSFYFTEPSKESFMVIDGAFYPYKSNGSFIKTFSADLQKPIKQFMRQAKIKVKSASDSQMRHLVEYCNALSHEN